MKLERVTPDPVKTIQLNNGLDTIKQMGILVKKKCLKCLKYLKCLKCLKCLNCLKCNMPKFKMAQVPEVPQVNMGELRMGLR